MEKTPCFPRQIHRPFADGNPPEPQRKTAHFPAMTKTYERGWSFEAIPTYNKAVMTDQANDIDDEDLLPWDRQPGETKDQFAAFIIFRDMGLGRSFRKAHAKMLGIPKSKHPGRFAVWSRDNRWQARVAAYDKHMDRLAVKEHERQVKQMVINHTTIAVEFQKKVAERIKTFDAKTLKPTEMIAWFETSAKIERLSRGQPSEHTKTDATVTMPDLSGLTDEELTLLEKLTARISKSNRDPAGKGEASAD